MTPIYQDAWLTLYHGDFRRMAQPARPFDMAIADPPYGQTSLPWDVWPRGWPAELLPVMADSSSLWVFGSIKIFMAYASDFTDWTFAQDLIWQKQNGTNFHADRFRRIHEQLLHFYRGNWNALYKQPQTTSDATARTVRRKKRPAHTGDGGQAHYTSVDGGPRLMTTIRPVRNAHGYAIHPTQKPTALIKPIIEYSCPPGGHILVPFAGSGSELEAARELGRHAVGYEINQDYAQAAAKRLAAYQPRLL